MGSPDQIYKRDVWIGTCIDPCIDKGAKSNQSFEGEESQQSDIPTGKVPGFLDGGNNYSQQNYICGQMGDRHLIGLE